MVLLYPVDHVGNLCVHVMNILVDLELKVQCILHSDLFIFYRLDTVTLVKLEACVREHGSTEDLIS